MATTLVGPTDFTPYRTSNHNYSYCEITPLYIGQFKEQIVDYSSTKKVQTRRNHGSALVGGAVEPFAVGVSGGKAPKTGVPAGQASAMLDVPVPRGYQHIDLRYAAGASGYAPGTFFESSFIKRFEESSSFFMDYWSPALDAPSLESNVWADGGSSDNTLLTGLLQRQVSSIVIFMNSGTPMKPAEDWNVHTDPTLTTSISSELAFYFGVEPEDYKSATDRVVNYEQSQVFASEEWAPFVDGMQKAQSKGKGTVYTSKLVTVKNDHWGIQGGFEVTLTVVYLGRSFEWEAALPEELKEVMVPEDPAAAADASETISKGPFKHFPHYATTGGEINAEKANALADLCGYVVLEHEDLLREVLA